MDKQRMLPKNRKFGSSHWKKRKGRYRSMQMSPILEEELFPSEILKKIQDFFQECDENKKGVITRVDMQKLKEEDLPWSTEELELVFDGLDSDGQGYLTIQEFIAGLSMH
ncbi:EF-hand calcium-binding domain-containing protein 4A-like [Eublepharis macularius]|uniref:EF-hand calcium-binding domain-containing protein 4A-like n=1 Tax=Eublepharis macularius TaxID=481883 RepID=A0AA97JBH3_EUBMA|nr:EF-hand calcium-binding domain-containing protein 4A-like [Eublepharis macularius]